jgi:hypothetical protein
MPFSTSSAIGFSLGMTPSSQPSPEGAGERRGGAFYEDPLSALAPGGRVVFSVVHPVITSHDPRESSTERRRRIPLVLLLAGARASGQVTAASPARVPRAPGR